MEMDGRAYLCRNVIWGHSWGAATSTELNWEARDRVSVYDRIELRVNLKNSSVYISIVQYHELKFIIGIFKLLRMVKHWVLVRWDDDFLFTFFKKNKNKTVQLTFRQVFFCFRRNFFPFAVTRHTQQTQIYHFKKFYKLFVDLRGLKWTNLQPIDNQLKWQQQPRKYSNQL